MSCTASLFRWRSSVLAALCAAPLCAVFGAEDDTSVAKMCIDRSTIRSTKVLNDRNILFVMRDRDKSTYNSALTKQCTGMQRGSPLSFAYSDGKLCAGSEFTVLARSGPSSNPMSYWDPTTNTRVVMQGPSFTPLAICRLGMFTPITPDEVTDLIAVTDQSRRSRRRDSRDVIKTEQVELPRENATSPAPKTE
jgi:hypothetical protein